jgi:hypothetical protein
VKLPPLRDLIWRDLIAALAVVFVCLSLWYLVRRLEEQKTFYRDLTTAHQQRQEEVYRHLYARTIVIRMMANALGISDEEIIKIAGPDAIHVPHPTPLPQIQDR